MIEVSIFVVFIVLVGMSIYLTFALKKAQATIKQLEQQLKTGHDRSLRTQRAVIKGQLAEQMFPLLASITDKYILSDFKFFGGNPIDYLLFDGLTEAKDNGGEFNEVVLIDIKTGDAKLSEHQKKIKEACELKRVRYATWRLLEDGTFKEEK